MESFVTYDYDDERIGITKFLNNKISEGYSVLSVTPTYYLKKMSGDLELRGATVHLRKL